MGTEIECPFHQGRFDIRTGCATAAPCTQALRTWTVHTIDGQLCIDPTGVSGGGAVSRARARRDRRFRAGGRPCRRGFAPGRPCRPDHPDRRRVPPPYERPSLSKEFLSSAAAEQTCVGAAFGLVHRGRHHAAAGQKGRRRGSVTCRSVELDDGSRIEYQSLILTTGTRPRPLVVYGADHPLVSYLRTIEDSRAAAAALVIGRAHRGDRRRFHRHGGGGYRCVARLRGHGAGTRGLADGARHSARCSALSTPTCIGARASICACRPASAVSPTRMAGRSSTPIAAMRSRRTRWWSASASFPTSSWRRRRARDRERNRRRRVRPHAQLTDLRRRRCHQSLQLAARPPRAPRVLAERAESGDRRGAQHPGCGQAVRRGAVVLERSVRVEPADRGHPPAGRRGRPARGSVGGGPVVFFHLRAGRLAAVIGINSARDVRFGKEIIALGGSPSAPSWPTLQSALASLYAAAKRSARAA